MMIFYFVCGKLFQVFLRINSQILTKEKLTLQQDADIV